TLNGGVVKSGSFNSCGSLLASLRLGLCRPGHGCLLPLALPAIAITKRLAGGAGAEGVDPLNLRLGKPAATIHVLAHSSGCLVNAEMRVDADDVILSAAYLFYRVIDLSQVEDGRAAAAAFRLYVIFEAFILNGHDLVTIEVLAIGAHRFGCISAHDDGTVLANEQ